MAAKKVRLVTPELTLRFPNLIKPRPDTAEVDAGMFTVLICIPKNNKPLVDQVKAAINEAADTFWAGKLPAVWNNPLKDGDTKLDADGKVKEYAKGMYLINAKTGAAYKPKVFDGKNVEIIDSDEVDTLAWFKGRASLNLSGYDTAGNKGVGVYLNQVQVVTKGDSLASGQSEFDVVADDPFQM